MCDKMAISTYIMKIAENDPFLRLQMRAIEMFTLLKYVKSQRSYGFFNRKRADFWLPNFGFRRSLLSLLKVIKDQIQYRSRSLLNLTRGYFI